MFFNKNGLKINLNFPHSLNEKDISELNSKKLNKHLIRKESAIFFSKTTKSVEINIKKEQPKLLRKYSYNFPIISRLKISKEFIINKTSKFDIINQKKPKEEKNNIFEIIKLNNINIIVPKKIIETELKIDIKSEEKKDKEGKVEDKEKENEKQPIIKKRLFENLKSVQSNNLFIKGNMKNNIIEIQNKINEIRLIGNTKFKNFEYIDIVNKVNDITIEKIEKIEKKIITKEIEIKPINIENIEIKPNIIPKEKINNIENNVISFFISGTSKVKEEKILSIERSINNFEIIHKSNKNKKNKFNNLTEINNINFDIKKKKKSPRVILRKVDGFGNISNKLFIKKDIINNKEISKNGDEDNNIKKKIENKGGIYTKIDKFKTKSPNRIQIKINNNNQDNNINFNNNENNSNTKYKTQKISNLNKESKNAITINTINNEIIYNKQTFDFPVINTELLNIEEQYEKIKKDLNDLYPVFNKNKKYRENFFLQLSQGNHDKYNFYTNLYKIIKDEQEEKNNNYFSNYLKMKKIIGNVNTSNKSKSKNKLKPLKKNKSSHYIFAKDKTFPLNTEY